MSEASAPSRTRQAGVMAVTAILVLGLAAPPLVEGAIIPRREAASPTLQPRSVSAKPARTVIPPGYSDRSLHLKLVEGSTVRLRNNQLVDIEGLSVGDLHGVLDGYPGVTIGRLFSRSEEVLERQKRRIEMKSGREQADKNLYFRLRIPEGASLGALIDDLNSLAMVEIAYPEPLPMPMPVTPDFEDQQGYRDPAPDGIDADTATEVCGARGSAITVADIEYSWNLSHEDLGSAAGALVPNQTPVDPFGDNDHGTAVLGEMVSGDNGFGVTGIIHQAGVIVVNANNDEDGYDLADSIDIAHANLAAGDVLLIEQQISGPNGCNNGVSGCVAVEWVEAYYDAIVAATSDGIIVVEAAGNGAENLDDGATYGTPFPDGRADSGAIIVGSGGSCINPERSRRPSSTFGARVNLQGWGECVVTTGYGTLQGGPVNEWYASGFNGTSSASPIVAGAAGALSSAAQTLLGGPPSPTGVRATLMATGTAQNTGAGTLAGNIGPMPDLKAALATVETVAPVLTCPASVVEECTSPAGAIVTYSVTATDDCDPTPTTTCTPPSGSLFPIAVTPTICESLDAVDNTGTCSFNVTVQDTTDPVLVCPDDITVECTGNCGIEASDPQLAGFFAGVMVSDVCDSSPTLVNDAPSFFMLGATPVTWTATDDHMNSTTCTAIVTVEDTIPPEITASLSRTTLWPPNHKLVEIAATVEVFDICDPNAGFVLTSITSDEPENGLGDGDTAPDIVDADFGTADTSFQLRSERSGTGDGRTYTITYTASDKSGNTTPVVVEVVVPHNRSGSALASSGFTKNGRGFQAGASEFSLIVPSTPLLDARAINAEGAMVGNHAGAVRPARHAVADFTGDGLVDLRLVYPVTAVREIGAAGNRSDSIGLHYERASDHSAYLVADIFALGKPLSLKERQKIAPR